MGADGGFIIARVKDEKKARRLIGTCLFSQATVRPTLVGAVGPFFISGYGTNVERSAMDLNDIMCLIDRADDDIRLDDWEYHKDASYGFKTIYHEAGTINWGCRYCALMRLLGPDATTKDAAQFFLDTADWANGEEVETWT